MLTNELNGGWEQIISAVSSANEHKFYICIIIIVAVLKLSTKIKKTISFVIKVIITALAVWFVLKRLFSIPADEYHNLYLSIVGCNAKLLCVFVLFVLLFANILVESIKWKYIVSETEIISLKNSIISVLGGITFGVATPNRIGEMFGKVFILKKTKASQGILLSAVGSISQLLVTFVVGILAFAIFSFKYLLPIVSHNPKYVILTYIALFGLLVFCVGFVLFYFNFGIVSRLLKKFSSKINDIAQVIYEIQRRKLLNIFLLSLLKYVIFWFQYYLCFRIVGFNACGCVLLLVIPLIYLGLALIPVFTIADFGVRGSLAVVLLGVVMGFGLNAPESISSPALIASTLIWFVNIAIPSLLGIFAVYKYKIL
ncbi:MAG: lysylphosphatidylglycerol synthase domain-containing protein [Bacteroidales bacterium]